MKCPRCQKEVSDDNIYCPYCGSRLPQKEDPALKELNEVRKLIFVKVMNRLLNIATIIAVVFAIVGVFGPVISTTWGIATNDIGGLYWFSYQGWLMLQDGQLAVGPYITTFVLYILTVGGVISLGSLAITRAINSLRRREECKTVPYIFGMLIIHRVYCAFVNCFYYENVYNSNYSYSTGGGWGETLFNFAIPLFTIALFVYIIVKAIFTKDAKIIVSRILAIIGASSLLSLIGSSFTVLGTQDVNLTEQIVLGTLRYFETNNVGAMPALIIWIMFGLGVLFVGTSIALGITTIRNLVKSDTIDRKLFLNLSIANAVIGLAMLIVDIVFGAFVNQIEGLESYIFHISGDVMLIFLGTQMVLGFGIALSCIKEKPADPNIIDAEVIEK